ncbi:MAG: hypothetical protein GX287_08045 [Fusobacteria bacterium]|nr:hypothetical protein [Fusobacteriota bacterium]
MKKIKNRYSQIIFKIIFIFTLTVVSYSLFNIYFNDIVQKILLKTLNVEIKFDKVKFYNIGKLKITNVTLKNLEKEELVRAKEVIIDYNIKNLKHISSITVKNAIISIRMYDNYDISIVEAFSNDDEVEEIIEEFVKKNKVSENLHEKSHENEVKESILDKIIVLNSVLKYRDEMHKIPIEKTLNNLNGELNFNDAYGISIIAVGSNKTERFEFNLYTTKDDKKEFILNIHDLEINNDILQYGYSDESINFEKGFADVNLKYDNTGITGDVLFKGVRVKYSDIKNKIEYINGKVDLYNDHVFIEATGYLQKNKVNFDLLYDFNKENLNINVEVGNINYRDLKNYKALDEIDLNINGNINYGKLSLNYNVANDKLDLDIIGNADRIFIENHEISYIDAKINYSDNIWNLNKIIFNYGNEVYDNINVAADVVLDGIATEDDVSINFNINNIDTIIEAEYILGNLNYNFSNQKLIINYKNNDFKGNLNYNKEKKLNLNIDIKNVVKFNYDKYSGKVLGEIDFNYNFKTNKIEKTYYDLKVIGFYDIDKISLEGSVVDTNFDFKKIYIVNNESDIYFLGNYNFKSGKYDFKIIQIYANLKEFITELPSDIYITGRGNITGLNDKFTLESTVNSYNGAYILDYEILRGKIKLDYNKGKIRANGSSILKKLGYKNQYVQDLDIKYRYNNDTLYIDKFSNNILTITGNCNIIDMNLDLKYRLNNYKLKEIELLKEYELKGDITEISGIVKGKIDNLTITTSLKNINLQYKDIKNININGDLKLQDGILAVNKVSINNNLINGKYEIASRNFDVKLNIMEENFNKYYTIPNFPLTFKAIGELNLWGNLEDVKSTGKLSLSNVYYNGIEIPKLYLQYSYNKGNLNDILNTGVFNLSNIEFINKKGELLLNASAIFDVINKKTEINLKEQELDLKKLQYLYPNTSFDGKLKMQFNLKSDLFKMEYKAKIMSDLITINNIEIRDIKNQISGNEDEINIDTVSMNYNKNLVNFYGNLKLNPFEYNFKIVAKNAELEFLNLFLRDKIKDIKGTANINITLTDKESRGSLILKKVSFKDLDNYADVEDVNANINFEKQIINISKFSGKINKGSFNIEGFVGLPKIEAEQLTNFREMRNNKKLKLNFEESPFGKLDSNLNIKFENIIYYYQNLIKLNFSGNLKMKNKKLDGIITLNEGEIRGIPENIHTKTEDNDLNILSLVDLDITFLIKNGMKISLDKFSVIEDIEANIGGGGKLKNIGTNLNFVGTLSAEKGVITFNNNFFEIEESVVIFDDPYRYLDNLSPIISITAKTEIASEKIYVKINGTYPELTYILLAENPDLSHEDIISLLAFHNKLTDSTPQGVVKDRLEEQLRKELFDPISKKIEEIFALSKVKLYSDVLKQNGEEITITEDLRLGASIELKDLFYKNFLFWNLKVKLSSDEPGQLDYYDFWFDYNIRENISVSLGMQRKQKTETETEGNLHIDLEFRKRFDVNFF